MGFEDNHLDDIFDRQGRQRDQREGDLTLPNPDRGGLFLRLGSLPKGVANTDIEDPFMRDKITAHELAEK